MPTSATRSPEAASTEAQLTRPSPSAQISSARGSGADHVRSGCSTPTPEAATIPASSIGTSMLGASGEARGPRQVCIVKPASRAASNTP
jgi:hypothetical protein